MTVIIIKIQLTKASGLIGLSGILSVAQVFNNVLKLYTVLVTVVNGISCWSGFWANVMQTLAPPCLKISFSYFYVTYAKVFQEENEKSRFFP